MSLVEGYQYYLAKGCVPEYLQTEFLCAHSRALQIPPSISTDLEEENIALLEGAERLLAEYDRSPHTGEESPCFVFGSGHTIVLDAWYPLGYLASALEHFEAAAEFYEPENLRRCCVVMGLSLIGIALWVEANLDAVEDSRRILAKLAFRCLDCVQTAEIFCIEDPLPFQRFESQLAETRRLVASVEGTKSALLANPEQLHVKRRLFDYWNKHRGQFKNTTQLVKHFTNSEMSLDEQNAFADGNAQRTLYEYLRKAINAYKSKWKLNDLE